MLAGISSLVPLHSRVGEKQSLLLSSQLCLSQVHLLQYGMQRKGKGESEGFYHNRNFPSQTASLSHSNKTLILSPSPPTSSGQPPTVGAPHSPGSLWGESHPQSRPCVLTRKASLSVRVPLLPIIAPTNKPPSSEEG